VFVLAVDERYSISPRVVDGFNALVVVSTDDPSVRIALAPSLTSGGGIGGGGAGGGGTIAEIAGATSLKNLTDRLLGVQTKITDLTFQTITGGISKSSAQKQLNKLTAEFDVLTNQANALVAQQPVGSPFGQAGGNTTNIYVSGAVVDPEGLNRVITDIQNQSASRGTVYTPFVP